MDRQASDVSESERANNLYWGTDLGVNQIADQLGLSKASLYGLVQPNPTGALCALCGTETSYTNRTARDRNEAECAACAGELDELAAVQADSDSGGPAVEPGSLRTSATRSQLAGTALLGIAAGLAIAAFWSRR